MQKRLFCCLLLALVGVSGLFAQQTPTTQGTEFWVSFMRNGYRNLNDPNPELEKLIMIASAKRGCTVTVRNPNQNWERSFVVGNNGVATFSVPDAQGYNDQRYGISNKGLLVTSTDTISLYIANEAQNSYDAANVLPIQALGSSYLVQSNKSIGEQSNHPSENRASFLIIAPEDNTQIRITPTCETWDGHTAGNPYTIMLQSGECYHVLSKNQGSTYNAEGDFSGTTIESIEGKRIAVFNGNCITSIPGGASSGFDHVFEQAMPVDHWGKRFVVTSTYAPANFSLLNDQVKITALYDNTTVWRDGTEISQLHAGESCLFEMDLNSAPCTYLTSDNPIAVYLYNHSHRQSSSPNGTTYGDPSMVWISPVEQTIREITFSTFQATNGLTHFVNLVCYTASVGQLTYDNNHISSYFTPVPSAPEFSYARLDNVTAGAHSIRCPGGFVAHVYGIGPQEGYAYTVGSSAKTLTNQLFVNEELVTDYSICQSETLDFRLETNYEPDLVIWNFGDNSPTEQGAEVSHTYSFDGDYAVEVVVNSTVNGTPHSDTLGVMIHVMPQIEVWHEDSTCSPVYFFNGIEFPVPFFGDSIVPSDEGCETIYHMSLMEGSSQSFVKYDTACLEYSWFDTIRYVSGTYVVVLGLPGGCDSLFILHLTIGKPPENPVRYKTSCSPYNWDNRIVCDTTGTYRLSFTTDDYCEYDSVLYFTRNYEPPFERIVGLSQVAVATTFWPGKYNYYLDDSTGMNLSRIQWDLMGNPEGPEHWEFVPHGASCTITAYSMGERVLWVDVGDEFCGKEAFMTINCTAYSVEEDELSSLNIYPNPARDELTVKGPELLELNLYNLLGQKMKSVSADGLVEVKVGVGDLPPALYLLEVRTRRGNKTRLVSVIR